MDDDILPENADQAIIEAIESGNKLTAIKLYRMKYGVSLKGAKDQIESLSSQRVVLKASELDSEIHEALRKGAQLNAIRLYREKYGVDLKTAYERTKEIVASGAYPKQKNTASIIAAKLVIFLIELAAVAIGAYFINRLF